MVAWSAPIRDGRTYSTLQRRLFAPARLEDYLGQLRTSANAFLARRLQYPLHDVETEPGSETHNSPTAQSACD